MERAFASDKTVLFYDVGAGGVPVLALGRVSNLNSSGHHEENQPACQVQGF